MYIKPYGIKKIPSEVLIRLELRSRENDLIHVCTGLLTVALD